MLKTNVLMSGIVVCIVAMQSANAIELSSESESGTTWTIYERTIRQDRSLISALVGIEEKITPPPSENKAPYFRTSKTYYSISGCEVGYGLFTGQKQGYQAWSQEWVLEGTSMGDWIARTLCSYYKPPQKRQARK